MGRDVHGDVIGPGVLVEVVIGRRVLERCGEGGRGGRVMRGVNGVGVGGVRDTVTNVVDGIERGLGRHTVVGDGH